MVRYKEAYYQCVADGNPQAKITWLFQNRSVCGYFDSFRVWTSKHGNKVRSNLIIMTTKLFDRGDLNCMAVNKHGNDSASLKLQIRG